jgi:hypothetical protein
MISILGAVAKMHDAQLYVEHREFGKRGVELFRVWIGVPPAPVAAIVMLDDESLYQRASQAVDSQLVEINGVRLLCPLAAARR